MIARLERHHHRIDTVDRSGIAAHCDGGGLGMGRAGSAMRRDGQQRTVAVEHGTADGRVRGGRATKLLGRLDSLRHRLRQVGRKVARASEKRIAMSTKRALGRLRPRSAAQGLWLMR